MMLSRRSLSASLVTGAGLSLLPGSSKAQGTGPAYVRNIVLVHGLYADGSSWSNVIVPLQLAGFNVTSVQNPLTSLEESAAAAQSAIAMQDGPTVLAGHSWSGTVVSQVGVDPKITALVFVAARAPDAGEDFTALAAQFPTPPASAGIVATNGLIQLSENAFFNDFANGVDPLKAGSLYAAQGQAVATIVSDRTTVAAWRSKPSWYAVSKQDRTINPDLERFLARRMNATTIELNSGHLSLVSHPRAITGLIMSAAGRTKWGPAVESYFR